MKRQLKEATVDEIEKKFDKTLKAVREEAKAVKDDDTINWMAAEPDSLRE